MEINKDTMTTNVECKKCKTVFTIGPSNITFDKMYEDENGRSIFLTYFDCPECQERHYVQIDNQQSREVKKKTQRMFAQLSAMRNKNRQIPKQQRNKFNRLRKNLNTRRFELMKQYDGSIVTDTETGDKIKLNFILV
jgi:ssDNA-binding Zn-finger/Zn-ribbon topoisomerase 1